VPPEYDWLRKTLIQLSDRAERDWRSSHENLARHLIGSGFFIGKDALERIMPLETPHSVSIPPEEGHELYRPNWGLVLPGLPQGQRYLPILCFRWSFRERGGQRGQLRLFVLSCADFDRQLQAGASNSIRAFSLHLDDWENNKDWCFGHCQVSDSTAPYQGLLEPLPAWLPARIPRIPLAGGTSSAGGILYCVIAGLYGLQNPTTRLVLSNMPEHVAKLRESLCHGPAR
jgi:hypothetical protein